MEQEEEEEGRYIILYDKVTSATDLCGRLVVVVVGAGGGGRRCRGEGCFVECEVIAYSSPKEEAGGGGGAGNARGAASGGLAPRQAHLRIPRPRLAGSMQQRRRQHLFAS